MDQKIAYRPDEALKVLPMCRTALYEKLRSGEIASFRVGRARFIPREALVAFMNGELERQAEGEAV